MKEALEKNNEAILLLVDLISRLIERMAKNEEMLQNEIDELKKLITKHHPE